MKTEKKLLIAFILNLSFSFFELVGGMFTGSVAIISDAIHDMGDAASIGISCFLEKKSKRHADENYTYGYARYSVMGSVITSLLLLFGAVFVIINSLSRVCRPTEINYDGMIIFAVFGLAVNFCAALITGHGKSLNQRAVNLHMLEDTLGWAVVLIGAIVMRFTDFAIIDPLMSVGIGVFIIINAVKCLKDALDLFLEKTPCGIDVKSLAEQLSCIDGVLKVHHIHVWSIDGQENYATMHIVTNADQQRIKEQTREKLAMLGIGHATLELESESENRIGE